MRARFLVPLLLAMMPACAPGGADEADAEDGEAAESEDAVVALTEPDETAPASALAAAPLDKDAVSDLIDVRGVGDAGWSNTHEATAIAADYGKALDRFDPTGKGYRGDLSFINWETVVGTSCTRFGSPYAQGRSYAFVSRAENLTQASERGFNLVGLSNNHSRDCHGSPESSLSGEVVSPDMTAKALEGLGDTSFLWAGISSTRDERDAMRAKVKTFTVKGRQVRVALGSLYTGREACPRAACMGDRRALLESLRDAQADLRILALHSRASADQDDAVRLGIEFVKRYGGDIVFGHGPHVWKPVRVVRKDAAFGGGAGVVFESLGNFLHPSLAVQQQNFIGRALLDARTLELRQVQVLPVVNSGRDIRWSTADGARVTANLRWTPAERGVFANVKR
ncbi:MAG: CapA family protein [Labilithrix sp.]|nr:CapA family protein [Labilithrix sp.]